MIVAPARPGERALRADAQRNLVRVLDVAREVFAEQGVDAPVTEIAERAGVGVGTIFRHFPTKDDLLAAVFEQRIRGLVAAADRALGTADPERALRAFIRAAAEAHIGDRGFCQASGSEIFARPVLRALLDELVERVGVLLRRAQAVGAVRPDVTTEDLPVLLSAIGHIGLLLADAAPGAWKRYVDLVLDGLRPGVARPLSRRPLTRREFHAVRCGKRA